MLDLVVYENVVKSHFSIPFCEYLVFTSPLNAKAYFQKYKFKEQQKVIAIGKTTATALKKLGVKKMVIASIPSEQALVKKLLTNFNFYMKTILRS